MEVMDRKNVIKGLEVILEDTADMFYRSTIQDAIALLKAQEPRVMTLKEPERDWQNRILFIEKAGELTPCKNIGFEDKMMFGKMTRIMRFVLMGQSNSIGYRMEKYGKTWRCWTSRPTDVQREVTQWD